jgi:serine/threonine-protein kinase
MPPSTAPLAGRDEFLAALRAAGVLTPHQFNRAQALALGTADSAAGAAAALVGAGLLTRFQADRLLAGHADGFVLGQHVVLELVGRGAVSRVYKAKHRTMNRPVAIKVLSEELTGTAAAREEFRRGVRAAGQLAHPNIVTAYDAGELHDRPYLVLEFVDGPNLESLVRRRGPLPVGEACEYVRQAAAGLQHAHDRGMPHRDLKPANLMVARPTPAAPLTLKVADFGIPKSALGATDYAAPELLGARPAPADHRADLDSLGCFIYFLLTGRAPFAGGTPVERARRRAREEAPPLFQLRPDAPPEVAAIVHRLLAKDPAARLASAADLLVRLEVLCVPVAIPVGGEVCFEVPPGRAGEGTGFLTGREPLPPEAATPTPAGAGDFTLPNAEASPWSQLTDVAGEGDTLTAEFESHAPRRPKPPGRGGVPAWMTAMLLVSAVLLCLAGIGVVVKLMAK